MLGEANRARAYLPPLDAARLKMFAAIIMLVDHVTFVFLERARAADGRVLLYAVPHGELLDSIGRAIGRQAFPIFCFFLVEGFLRTRSRARYLARLALFAALSLFPFQKACFPQADVLHANVIVTLGIGFLAIWTIDGLAKILFSAALKLGRKWGGIDSGPAAAGRDASPGADGAAGRAGAGAETAGRGDPGACALPQAKPSLRWAFSGMWAVFLLAALASTYGYCRLADFLHSDYGRGGVLVIVILYVFRKNRMAALLLSWCWLSWYNSTELYSAPAFFLLACYNGERGRQWKYFFYIFYPAHLLALWLVRRRFFGF